MSSQWFLFLSTFRVKNVIGVIKIKIKIVNILDKLRISWFLFLSTFRVKNVIGVIKWISFYSNRMFLFQIYDKYELAYFIHTLGTFGWACQTYLSIEGQHWLFNSEVTLQDYNWTVFSMFSDIVNKWCVWYQYLLLFKWSTSRFNEYFLLEKIDIYNCK